MSELWRNFLHRAKAIILRFFRLFHRKKPAFEMDKQLVARMEADTKRTENWLRRHPEHSAKRVNTSRGGPNMPKRQPCPKCHGWRRRQDKVATKHQVGAWYYCSRCDLRFFETA